MFKELIVDFITIVALVSNLSLFQDNPLKIKNDYLDDFNTSSIEENNSENKELYDDLIQDFNSFMENFHENSAYSDDYEVSEYVSGETSFPFEHVTKLNFVDEVLKEEFVVVKFGGDFCKYCVKMAPDLLAVSEERKDIKFVDVDCTYEEALCEYYKTTGYPTTIVFKNGKEFSRAEYRIKKDEIFKLIEGENFVFEEHI